MYRTGYHSIFEFCKLHLVEKDEEKNAKVLFARVREYDGPTSFDAS